jgi:probable phosphoglycerate mutase
MIYLLCIKIILEMERIIFDNYPKSLVLVRHGQSVLNIGKTGVSDMEAKLTDLGKKQACIARKGFLHYGPFDVIYHTGYRRTFDTMNCIIDESDNHPKIIEDFRLREREAGYLVGMSREEISVNFPWFQGYYEITHPFYLRPPGGESMADLYERIKVALNDIFKQHSGKRILFVSHGRVISVIRFMLEPDWSVERAGNFIKGCGPRNCSFTVYMKNGDFMDLMEYDKVF